jgi:hypothetical protein
MEYSCRKRLRNHCNAALLYGLALPMPLNQTPRSVFLADGSDIQVYKGAKIKNAASLAV